MNMNSTLVIIALVVVWLVVGKLNAIQGKLDAIEERLKSENEKREEAQARAMRMMTPPTGWWWQELPPSEKRKWRNAAIGFAVLGIIAAVGFYWNGTDTTTTSRRTDPLLKTFTETGKVTGTASGH